MSYRTTRGGAQLFLAPTSLWILGFMLLGIVSGARFAALRARQPSKTR